MKSFVLIAAGLIALAAHVSSQGFLSPGVVPYFGIGGPFGGGLLFRGLFGGGLGFGGLGGFGGFGGFGFPGARVFSPLRGKRDALNVVNATETIAAALQENISCKLSNTLLNCTGLHEIIECEVRAHNVSADLPRLRSIDFVLKDQTVDNEPVIKVVPKKFVNKVMGHLHNRVSIFSHTNASSTVETSGFQVLDHACFLEVAAIVQTLPEKIKLAFQ